MTGRPPVRADLSRLSRYHSPQVDVAVRLNTNESPLPPPPEFSAAVARRVGEIEWNRYPDRTARALREAIGAMHGVGSEQVFVANGSNEVLQTLCLTYGGPGRRAAVFEPTYALHSHISNITGTELVIGQRDDRFLISPNELGRVLDEQPEILFLCSPNNPTGRAEPVDLVAAAIDGAPGLVIVDEAYAEFSSWSAVDLVRPDAATVVTRTFSKTWSLAAARLGYLVGPSWLVAELDKVVLPYHLDTMQQIAGLVALEYTDEMTERVSAVVAQRNRIAEALADLGVEVWPSEANFVLFRPPGGADAVWEALVDRSVLVRNCASWPRLEGCLRITVGTEGENEAFLGALADSLDDIVGSRA